MENIKEVQEALYICGCYPGKPDGIMGPNTKKGIKEFQEKHGLDADGIAGPKTRAALVEELGTVMGRIPVLLLALGTAEAGA